MTFHFKPHYLRWVFLSTLLLAFLVFRHFLFILSYFIELTYLFNQTFLFILDYFLRFIDNSEDLLDYLMYF